jgi:hypothetical protein
MLLIFRGPFMMYSGISLEIKASIALCTGEIRFAIFHVHLKILFMELRRALVSLQQRFVILVMARELRQALRKINARNVEARVA